MSDATFYYFKPGGKWKYDGRGVFPKPLNPGVYYEVDRDAIIRENGSMPGLVEGSRASDFVIIVIPDEDCDVRTAFPRMLHPEVSA